MKKEFKRADRIADLVQRELAQIVQREIKDPRLGLITLSAVKMSDDLLHARVYVTLFNAADIKESLATLNKTAPYLRSLLAKKLNLRVTPEIYFVYDETLVYGNRLVSLIDKAIKSDKKIED